MRICDWSSDVCSSDLRVVGDDVRQVGPPWLKNAQGEDSDQSTYFQTVNRNKRSITIDYTRPEGADIILRLAKNAQIFIENYRTGTLARHGLGYEDIKQVNP